ncbi:hypothetical protein B0I35DRAFT_474709 [Stachybotrys elegans]|uniref:GST N-terminal domain-containing protein n=1 Tax=Stachybotrys elegans TaxID=80388 RepID=A0A8K0SZ03_9HYPO|nr:hypothetical protein B0I35DRAFT_474709 [Stachybotrys elegans]
MAANNIVVYHYNYSPYARRLIWYLSLRGISYTQCMQPPMMPRPDLGRLGVRYRRIPVMTIGRDVYLDTQLQISKLEEMYPSVPRLGASSGEQKALQKLLSVLMIDAGAFQNGVQLLPTNLPLLKNEAYFKDRSDFIGAELSAESMNKRRPAAIVEMQRIFDFLETTLLADGRDWILNTEGPSLGDIEGVWALHWLTGIPGALPADKFSTSAYPRVFAWIQRFQSAVSASKKRLGQQATVTGEEAARAIEQSAYSGEEGIIDGEDAVVQALGLKKGDAIMVWPTDTGSSCKDVGRLVAINGEEVVLETQTAEGVALRIHAPRHGYRVARAAGDMRERL